LIFFIFINIFIYKLRSRREQYINKMILTYNIQLQPDKTTYDYWVSLLTDTAKAYDLCSGLLADNNTPLTIKSVHNTCYNVVREQFPNLPAQSVIRVQKEAMSALRSRKGNKHNGDKPTKHNLSLTLDKRMYSRLTPENIAICGGIKGKRTTVPFVTYDKEKQMFSMYKPCDPLLFLRSNTLWLSVPFNVPDTVVCNDNSIGVDLGMKRLFVTSEGNAFVDKEYLRNRRKLRYLKRCLQSKGTKSAKRHLKKVSRRERNMSRDMQNRAVLALIESTDAGVIVMEDLSKIKKNTSKSNDGFKRKRHNNAIAQVPFAEFKTRLTNKAHLFGKEVKTVSPVYTSQTDCRNDKRNGKRNGCRYYCKDGLVLDADWNAAVNIAKKGKHPFSNILPVDGRLRFLNGRVSSITQLSASLNGNGQAPHFREG